MRRVPLLLIVLLLAPFVVQATPAGAATDPVSPEEMLFIHELNLMRWNPAAFGLDTDPTFPLAVNDDLSEATGFKAGFMLDLNCQPPTEDDGQSGWHDEPEWANRLAEQYGYDLPDHWSLDANFIEAIWCSSGASAIPSPSIFTNSSAEAHRGLALGFGGWAEYNEIGVGYERAGQAALSMMTAMRAGPARMFVTGVVYDDRDDDGRMDLGEGISGAEVRVGSTTTTTNAGGGYSVMVPSSGTYDVASPGAGIGVVEVASENVGVDFVVGRATPIVRSEAATAERWYGADRYETAAEVSRQTHPSGADTVYVAVGDNFADAIAAGPAAARVGAPILLTRSGDLPAATRRELQRLAPNRVVVAGGSAAISGGVVDEIRAALGSGTDVDRLAGSNRYETAVTLSQDAFGRSTTVFVATGENFPDALVGVPAAISQDAPLLLVPPSSLPTSVIDELERLRPTQIVVLGGVNAIGPSVVTGLSLIAPVTRIGATNRYALSAEIARRFFDHPSNVSFVAVGTDFPDALAGGAATATITGPILLTDPSGLPGSVGNELLSLAPNRIVILGGPAVISNALALEIARYLG